MPIDPVTGSMIAGAGMQGLSMLGQNRRNKKAFRQQKKLMDLQMQNQMGLNQQGHQLAMDMWNKTNYGAQVEHMKEAGLNPALMYGQAGAGGQTGSGSGGSAASGGAPAVQPMDMQNMLIGAQIAKLNAETKNIDKDTNVKDYTIGNIIASTDDLKAKAKLSNAQRNIYRLEYEFGKDSYNNRLKQIGADLGNAAIDLDLKKEQFDYLVETTMYDAIKTANESEKIETENKLTQKELNAFEKVLALKIKEVNIQEFNADTNKMNAWTNELKVAIDKELGNEKLSNERWSIGASILNNIISGAFSLAQQLPF